MQADAETAYAHLAAVIRSARVLNAEGLVIGELWTEELCASYRSAKLDYERAATASM